MLLYITNCTIVKLIYIYKVIALEEIYSPNAGRFLNATKQSKHLQRNNNTLD